ncbi:MAG: nitrate- and nitrite sensing domain-containing protein, partial [Parahaliea sp.]
MDRALASPFKSLFRFSRYMVFIIVCLVLLTLFLQSIVAKRDDMGEMRSDIALLEAAAALGKLLHHIQAERSFTFGFAMADPVSNEQRLKALRSATDDEVVAASEQFARTTEGENVDFRRMVASVHENLELLADWRRIADTRAQGAVQLFERYTSVNLNLLDSIRQQIFFIQTPALRQNMTAYQYLLWHKELLAQERAILSEVFATGRFGPQLHRKFLEIGVDAEKSISMFRSLASPAIAALADRTVAASAERSNALRQIAAERALRRDSGETPGEWWQARTAYVDAWYQDELQIMASLRQESGDNKANLRVQLA